MNELTCAWVRDRLPEYARAELDPAVAGAIEAHVPECESCTSELELVGILRDLRAPVPAGLDTRVLSAAATRHRAGTWSPGRLAMAATVAFALVTAGIVWQSNGDDGAARPDLAGPATVDWTTGEPAILRGGVDLGSLSEEELMKLLEELDS